MRTFWFITPLLLTLLPSCNKQDEQTNTPPKEEAPRISYTTEIRPLLIENCTSCHQNLPLHNPTSWSLDHQHLDKSVSTPHLLTEWLSDGAKIDPHWATTPIKKIDVLTLDQLLSVDPDAPVQTITRKTQTPLFTSSVTELLAGDHLADKAKTISTGYLRQAPDTPTNRAEKIAQQFLGTRISCAQCHDHPNENWTQKRYDDFTHIFTTTYDHHLNAKPPIYIRSTPEQQAAESELQGQLDQLPSDPAIDENHYQSWIENQQQLIIPKLAAAYSFNEADLQNQGLHPGVRATGQQLPTAPSIHGLGIHLKDQSQLTITGLPFNNPLHPFTISAWIKLTPQALKESSLITLGSPDHGFQALISEGKLQARWTHTWPQLAAAVTSEIPITIEERWCHIAITYDGTRRAQGFKFHLNGKPIDTKITHNNLKKTINQNPAPLTLTGNDLILDELQIYSTNLSDLSIRHLFDNQSLTNSNISEQDIRNYYQHNYNYNTLTHRQKINQINQQLILIQNEQPAFLVMDHLPDLVDTEPDHPKNRLEFAEGLNKNLLARSLANEIWRQHFQTPLVHGLGHSDPPPSNPDLLEWLAGKLLDNNFNIPALNAEIQRSQAWRHTWPELPDNRATCPRPDQ